MQPQQSTDFYCNKSNVSDTFSNCRTNSIASLGLFLSDARTRATACGMAWLKNRYHVQCNMWNVQNVDRKYIWKAC